MTTKYMDFEREFGKYILRTHWLNDVRLNFSSAILKRARIKITIPETRFLKANRVTPKYSVVLVIKSRYVAVRRVMKWPIAIQSLWLHLL